MLVNQKETREALRRIAFKLTSDRTLREDLTQEALFHLWQREKQRPGQTRSWYFQSCRFHLLNYLRNGRSVDSRHRYRTLARPIQAAHSPPHSVEESAFEDSVRALVSAREMADLLLNRLTSREWQVLGCLGEGFGIREIAARLNLTHTWVIRCRSRIARLALKLGIEPLPNRDGRHGGLNGSRGRSPKKKSAL